MAIADRKFIAFYSPYPNAGKTAAMWSIDLPALRHSFSEQIKTSIKDIFYLPGLGEENINKDKSIKRCGGRTYREICVAFGQFCKTIMPDVWIYHTAIDMGFSPSYFTIIDDLHFPDEYEFCKDEGAKIVRITNPGREIIKTETEALLEGYKFDYELINYKRSIEEYQAQLKEMIKSLFGDDFYDVYGKSSNYAGRL